METIILVVNFNGADHLQECLSSLIDQSYISRIVIIDDCSTDTSLDVVKYKFPALKIITLKKNIGFARAVNFGLNYIRNEYGTNYIAIVNNDTKADKDWLKNLISAMESDENIAAVASNMLFYDHTDIINSQGGKISFTGSGVDINYGKNISETNTLNKYIFSSSWGATLIRSEALDNIGLLDENYYSYYEDFDWSYRANMYGYKIIFEPNAIIYHKGSATWKNRLLRKTYLCRRNSLYMVLKNYELKNIIKASPMIIIDCFIRYPIGTMINRRVENGKLLPLFGKKVSFVARIIFLPISLMAFFWNLINIAKILKLRRKIQASRIIGDDAIFKLCKTI